MTGFQMTEIFKESALIVTAAPIYLIVIAFEIIFSHAHDKGYYSGKGTLTNFYLMALNMGLDVVVRGACLLVLDYFYGYHFFEYVPVVIYWLVLLFAQDFLFYLLHVADHYCRLFWAVHVTHHSSEEFNLTVGFRSSVFQPLYRFIYFIPLSLAGFNALDIMFMYSATQIYGILVHTQSIGRLGPLEYFMVTPSHHRVHHGSNPKYLDRNMGMVFIIWDRLFGTFQEEDEPVKFGITTKIDSSHPVQVLFHEWNSIASDVSRVENYTDKLKYVFYRPGWSHDGSRMTSEQLRNSHENSNVNINYPPNFSSLSSWPSKTA